MNLGDNLFETLKDLVANQVRPDTFPQSTTAIWPAIRFSIITGQVYESIHDDGDEETDDTLIQLDMVALSATKRDALWAAVRTRMNTFDPPARLQGVPRTSYDADTKTYMCSADYMIHPSSP